MRTVDSLGRGNEVRGARFVDAGHKLLRVAIDQGKPSGLNLDHNAMALQKDVIVIAQWNLPFGRFIGRQRVRLFVADEITAATDLHGDGQLVAIQRLRVLTGLGALVRVPGRLLSVVGINVDQFHDEVRIGARSGCKEFGGERPGDDKIVFEWRADITQHVRTIVDKPLIGDFPGAPVSSGIGRRDRTGGCPRPKPAWGRAGARPAP